MNSLNPLVSIVIPVYNGSNFLKEAIDSALAQTYKNIEIIVVNDGSCDNDQTSVIAKSYGNKIRYYEQENGGVALALNLGIKEMKGNYFSWLSHDDLYYPEKIETQIKLIRETNDKKCIFYTGFEVENYFVKRKYIQQQNFDGFNGDSLHDNLISLFSSRINGCSLLIPKEAFTIAGFFNEKLKTTQDYDFFFRLLLNQYYFKFIDKPLIMIRHHSEQDTHRLINLHKQELFELYSWAFKQFIPQYFSICNIDEINFFLKIMEKRKLTRCKDLIQSYISNRKINSNTGIKPIIWLYWENPMGLDTPYIIDLCLKTITKKNKNNFEIILVNPDNILFFLPALNINYLKFNQIAHKADYIRFNLLYLYGGIWLDSDFICMKSMKSILKKINYHGFVYVGYRTKDNDIFPIISFLGAEKKNEICHKMCSAIDHFIDSKLVNGIQPEWDEIGGNKLKEILKTVKADSYQYRCSRFYPISVHLDARTILYNKSIFLLLLKRPYGVSLAFSRLGDYYSLMRSRLFLTKSILSKVMLFSLGLDYFMFRYETLSKKINLNSSKQLFHLPFYWVIIKKFIKGHL